MALVFKTDEECAPPNRKNIYLTVTFRAWYSLKHLPSILEMLELCMSGQAFRIFLLSSLAHTMKAFIGRFMWGLFSLSLFCCLTILAEIETKD
jgi:hypothetical protein